MTEEKDRYRREAVAAFRAAVAASPDRRGEAVEELRRASARWIDVAGNLNGRRMSVMP